MSEKKTSWNVYVLTFLALWGGDIAIDLSSRLPAHDVRQVMLRRGFEAAVVTLALCFVNLGMGKKE
jgi:hypothetical protein